MFGELIQSAALSVTFAFVVSSAGTAGPETTEGSPPNPYPGRHAEQPAQDAPAARPYLSYRRAKAASSPMN